MARKFKRHVNVTGLDKVLKKFKDMKDLDMTKTLTAVAYVVMKYVQLESPYKSGYNKGRHEVRVLGKNRVKLMATSGYANYIEYGTAKMKANPYIRRGIRKSKEEVLKTFKEGLEAAVAEKMKG